MAFANKDKENFNFTINPDFDHIIEESNNTFIAARKISWGNREPKLDIRKWYSSADGSETMGKGISITDEGANELVKILAENGYGHTNEILEAIKDRDDFRSRLNKILGKDDPDYDETIKNDDVYYDPMKALFNDEEEIA